MNERGERAADFNLCASNPDALDYVSERTALLASLLDIPFKKAFPAVVLGILIATVSMSLVSYGLLGAIVGLFS